MKLYFKEIKTLVGMLKLIASDQALIAILWENEKPQRVPLQEQIKSEGHPLLLKAEGQLLEYLTGIREFFDIPIAYKGTAFQQAVWQALQSIPYGKTLSYKDIAKQIGRPLAVRAVGTAIGKNPLSIVIPCHRVIGANGSLTGFAGGIERKQILLNLESKMKRT